MREKKLLRFVDYVVIILNVSFQLSILPVYTIGLLPIPSSVSLLFFDVFVLFIRFKSVNLSLHYIKKDFFLSLFLFIYVADILQNVFITPVFAIARICTLLTVFLFVLYILSLYFEIKDKSVEPPILSLCKPYTLYTKYNVFVIIFCAFLFYFNIVDPFSNPIGSNSLTQDNVNSGAQYYFPMYLTLVESSSRLFGEFGMPDILGLSHENHVINYIVMPSLFLCLLLSKKMWAKAVYCASFFVALLFSWSTTAFLIMLVVIIGNLLWIVVVEKKRGYLFPILIVVGLGIIYAGPLIELIQLELVRKTVEQTGSMDYTFDMWSYILSPQSVFGAGNIPSSIVKGDKLFFATDIGAVSFLLDIIFFVLIIVRVFLCFVNSNRFDHYMGCCFLYFFLHTIKVNILAFNYPLFAFMIILLSLVTNTRNNRIVYGNT